MLNDKLKVQSLKTAMKNPRMAKLIMDAAKAPLGSSKREQAQGVITSLHTAQINKHQKGLIPVTIMPLTGKGGGGQGGAKNSMTYMVNPPDNKPLRISLKPALLSPYDFKAPEVPAPQPMSVKAPQHTGQGGPSYDGQGAGLPANTSYDPNASRAGGFLNNVGNSFKSLFKGTGTDLLSGPKAAVQGVSDFVGGTLGIPLAGVQGTWNYLFGSGANKPATLGGAINDTLGQRMFNQAVGANQPQALPNVPNVTNTKPTSAPANTGNPYIGADGVIYKPNPSDLEGMPVPVNGSQTDQSVSTNGTPYGPGLDSTGKSTVPGSSSASSGDPLVDYLMKSYGEGIGGNAFALGVMADANKLKSLFPGVPIDKLPIGASLAGQLNDLQDSLMKEYKVNELGDALTKNITQGTTLKDDVTSYIRGKDEFLNTVDKMLTNANDQYLASSMRSDPFYQQSMSQYTNYLTILKGRTTQRYIDYLNTSINYHNGQMQQLQGAYNKAADMVNSLYTQKAAVTTEQYNQIKDTLTQMYNNVATRAGIMDGTSKDALDLLKSKADLGASVLKNAALISNTADRQAYLNQYGPAAGLTGLNAASVTGKGAGSLSAADVQVVSDQVSKAKTLDQALNDPVLKANGVGPDIIAQKYAESKATSDKTTIESNPGDVSSMYTDFKAESKQLQDLIDQVKQQGGDTTALETLKDTYDQTRDTGFLDGIKSVIDSKLDVVKKMLNEMKGYSSYDEWAKAAPGVFNFTSNKDNADYKDLMGLAQYLFVVAMANKDSDFNSKSASEIANAVFGQF